MKNQYAILVFLFFSLFVIMSLEVADRISKLSSKVTFLETTSQSQSLKILELEERLRTYEIERYETKDVVMVKAVTFEEDYTTSEELISDELLLLARLIESESGNQSFEGKLAVGTVVMNRVESEEFPDTIEDVIFQKRQFSVVANGTIYNEPSNESIKAAKEVLDGKRILDSSVLYFYNPKLTNEKWIRTREITKRIGDHAFAI